MNNAKKTLRNSQVIPYLFQIYASAEVIKNITIGTYKENLFSSYFLAALEEAKMLLQFLAYILKTIS